METNSVTNQTGILVYYDVKDMPPTKYDAVIRDLEAIHLGKFNERPYHFTGIKENGNLVVVDIFTAPEELQKFGEKLMPILVKNGVTPPEPMVFPLYSHVTP